MDLLVFRLGDVRYGLELGCVREVVRAVLITPLPGAPAVVEGVIDVRGELVPVYDLRLRFGHAPAPLHPDERMVVAWTGERRVALRCDEADWQGSAGVVREPSVAARHVAGVVQLEDGLVLIQDLAVFLDDAERAELTAALAAAAR